MIVCLIWVKILSSENEYNNITLYSCYTFIITMYSGKAAWVSGRRWYAVMSHNKKGESESDIRQTE